MATLNPFCSSLVADLSSAASVYLCGTSEGRAFLSPVINSRKTSLICKRSGLIRCIAEPMEKTVYTTKVPRNGNIAKLQAGYLFPEIGRRRLAHMQKYPDAKVISLGIGDTTEPIPEVITSAMAQRAQALSTREGYSGYGAEQGEKALRTALSRTFYGDLGIKDSEIFVSDGAKCDISRLQLVFGSNVTIAVQDPSYPVMTSHLIKEMQFESILYLACIFREASQNAISLNTNHGKTG